MFADLAIGLGSGSGTIVISERWVFAGYLLLTQRQTQDFSQLYAVFDATGPVHDLLADDGHALVADGHGLRLWTFAGGRANNLLGRVLEVKLGPKIVIDSQYVAFREQAGLSVAAIRKALALCLSDRLESEFLAEVLTNEDEARSALGAPE